MAITLEEVEAELRRSEGRVTEVLGEVIQSIEDGAAIYDTDDRLVHFNEPYTRYFSRVLDILKPGISFREIFEAQAERGIYDGPESGMQAWVDGRVKLFDDGAKANEFQRVNGGWVRIDYYKLLGGGTFVVTADITQRKQSEIDLAQSKENLEEMVETRTGELNAANERFYTAFYANPAAMAITDLDGKLNEVNNRWVETFGHARGDALGNRYRLRNMGRSRRT